MFEDFSVGKIEIGNFMCIGGLEKNPQNRMKHYVSKVFIRYILLEKWVPF